MEVKMAAKIAIQTLLDAGCHYGPDSSLNLR